MKLGLFMMPLHSLKLGYKEMYDQDLEAALLVDRLGYDEFWIGEHTSAKVEPVTNALQFLSFLAPQTSKVKLCSGVVNLPMHHPTRVAADAAMLDHLSNGRFIMGIGPGGLASDFELFNTVDKNRQEMMVEAADMITGIWNSQAPYRFEGKYWSFRIEDAHQPDLGIGPMPVPFQTPFPSFSTSAMSPFSSTAKLAGTRGWDLVSANFNAPWIVKSHWQAYVAGAEEAGRRPDPKNWRVSRSILVGVSDQETADYMADPDNGILNYYSYMYTQMERAGALKIFLPYKDAPAEAITIQNALDSMVICGSVSTVVDKLVAFIDEIGPFGTLLSAFHEWDNKALWSASLARLKNDVMPKVAAYCRQKPAA